MHAGDPTATLKNGALVGVVNLILDPILMFPMGLGTAGAAIGKCDSPHYLLVESCYTILFSCRYVCTSHAVLCCTPTVQMLYTYMRTCMRVRAIVLDAVACNRVTHENFLCTYVINRDNSNWHCTVVWCSVLYHTAVQQTARSWS
jgi:hypothetical protein